MMRAIRNTTYNCVECAEPLDRIEIETSGEIIVKHPESKLDQACSSSGRKFIVPVVELEEMQG